MTTLPLSGAILQAYNNLPAIPPDDPLGDIINQLVASSTAASNRILVVAPDNGEYTTIREALTAAAALVPAPSSTNPVVIFVAPGTYSEQNPLQITEGIFLQTYDSSGSGSATVVATDPTSPVFEVLNTRCGLAGFAITGALLSSGVRMAAGVFDSCLFSRLLVTGCQTAVEQQSGIGVYIENQFLRTLGVMTRSVDVTGGQFLSVTGQVGGTPGQVVPEALVVTGGEARVVATTFLDSTQGISVSAGTTARVSASSCVRCTNGVSVNAATLVADGFLMQAHAGAVTDIEVIGSTSTVFWTGGRYNADRISLESTASLVIAAPTDREGGVDPSFSIVGELSVGTEEVPRESNFGQGDSHQRNMAVFTNTNGEVGTWDDITTDVEDSTTSTAVFPGTGIDNTVYFGGDVTFPGVSVIISSALTLGAGSLVWEYWDGVAWTAFDVLATKDGPPYSQYGNAVFERVDTEEIRFSDGIISAWATTSLNGSTKYWARCRITAAITTIPDTDFVKLSTNRANFSPCGFLSFFGDAEPVRDLLVHQRLSDDLAGASPANASLGLTTNITITPIDNHFQDGVLDGFGMIVIVPEGSDTSRSFALEVLWAPNTNNAGDVELEVNYGLVQTGDTLDNSVPDTNLSQIITVPLNDDDVVRKQTYNMEIPEAVPGDLLVFSLFRDAQAGNLDDTLAGNIKIVSIRAFANFWH